jgi:hypothetical protein
VYRDVSICLGFGRRVHGVAAADELVQPKRKNWKPRIWLARLETRQQ